MKLTFENPDKINGLLTLTVEEADYKQKVTDELKKRRRTAQMPGFRPGQVPMSLIQRTYAVPVKMDVINNIVGQEIYKYIGENKIQMLGEPLPSAKQEPQDLEKDGDLTFVFDIAVAPEINITLTGKDKFTFYNIAIDDKLVDGQVQQMASQMGSYSKGDVYDPEKRDILRGDLRELDADGNAKEGGIELANVPLMPQYIKVDEQKLLFDGAKPGDIITFNPTNAYPENPGEVASLIKVKREEVEQHTGDFTFQVTEVSRFTPHAIDQELFDRVYGKDQVTTEEDFRKRVAADLEKQFAPDSDIRFLLDVRKYCEEKVGKLQYPEEILKRVMQNNNKDKEADFVEKNFEGSIRELNWHLIKEKLVADNEVKISDADVIEAAKDAIRMQFAQYGMNNIPDEDLTRYAQDMVKKGENTQQYVDRSIDKKLIEKLKTVVKLTQKTISLEEFNKLFEQ